MADGGFTLRQLADMYSDTWREQSEKAGMKEFSRVGVRAIQSFVLFVERLQNEEK